MKHEKSDSARLASFIKDIKFAMLTTVTEAGEIFSRPMANQKIQPEKFDGKIWFFTKRDCPKVSSIEKNAHVNLAYADTSKQHYASVYGMASVSQDKLKMRELWSPALKAWFPEGLSDPEMVLICVDVHSAELWDSPSSKVVQLVGFAKSILTGKSMDKDMKTEFIDFHH